MPLNPVDTWGMKRLDPFMEPNEASEMPVMLTVSVTYAAGTVLGEVTATPGVFKAYASGSSDGSQNARCILRHACVTDASGFITYGDGPAGVNQDGIGPVSKYTDAFYSGVFKTQDLIGIDAASLAAMGGKIISGTLANGVCVIAGT